MPMAARPAPSNRSAAPLAHRWPEWLPKALREAALIVLSVVLALAVDEWRETRQRHERVRTALVSIRAELTENRRAIAKAGAYHQALADTLFALARAGAATPGDGLFSSGIIAPAEIVSTAWQSAQVIGATADMPYPTVLALSQAYHEQAGYERRKEAATQVLYGRALEGGWGAVMARYKDLAGIINDHASWERRLLTRYDRALQE